MMEQKKQFFWEKSDYFIKMHLSAYSFVFQKYLHKEHHSLSVILIAVKQLPIEKNTHVLKTCSDSLNLKVIPLFPNCFYVCPFKSIVSLHIDTGSVGSPKKPSAGMLSQLYRVHMLNSVLKTNYRIR